MLLAPLGPPELLLEQVGMRRLMAPYLSNRLLADTERFATATGIVRRAVADWPTGKPVPAHDAFQRVVAEQLGFLALGISTREYVDDIIYLLSAALRTQVSRQLPRVVTRLPRFRRAQRRVYAMLDGVREAHASGGSRAPRQSSNLVDDLLEFNSTDPHVIAQSDFRSFMHRAAMETLRLYPISVTLPRVAANSFRFEGHEIRSGDPVLVAHALAHMMEEYYPDPESFDIDRFTPERAEHKQPRTYMPFGTGPHQCLGRSLAEALLVLNTACWAHDARLALHPHDYKLKTVMRPALVPHKSLRFRVLSRASDAM